MCFSPEIDLLAGAGITAIGIDAIRHVDHPTQRALASLPIVFGVHQLIEAVVWWSLDGPIPAETGHRFALVYLSIAFGLIPWFIPMAVRCLEPDRRRRAVMAGLAHVGGLVAIYLMWATIRGPLEVFNGGTHVGYRVQLPAGGLVVGFYVLATCGSLLASSDRYVAMYGVANLIAVSGLSFLLYTGVISLWCAWAAVTSTAIAVHLRRTDVHHQPFRLRTADE